MSNKIGKKPAKTAEHKGVEVWQVPVFLDRDEKKHIGFVTLDPTKIPEGNFGLVPGTDENGKIVAFATSDKKGSTLVK